MILVYLALAYGIGLVGYQLIVEKKRKHQRIHLSFQTKQDRKWLMDEIRAYHDLLSPRGLDEVTWQDLSMDDVYKHVNHCYSYVGDQYLYRRLHDISLPQEGLIALHKLSENFKTNEGLREEAAKILHTLSPSRTRYRLIRFIEEIGSFRLERIWLYKGLGILLLVSILINILVGFRMLPLTGLVFFINFGVYTLTKLKLEGHLDHIGQIIELSGVATKLHKLLPDSLESHDQKDLRRINKYANHVFFLSLRKRLAMSGDLGAIVLDYLIGATFIDFFGFDKLVRGLSEESGVFYGVFDYVGGIDTALSLAAFLLQHEDYVQARFWDDPVVRMDQMAHPLIKNPIANLVDLKGHMMISGANASGKSTYMKGIAVNAILAQSLGIGRATKIQMPRCHIISSMAVRDDLISGESYYIKEIQYLKRITEEVVHETFTLCFIDEILRGTNAAERIAASGAILSYLEDKNCLALVATHDKALTALFGDRYSQVHFSEDIKDGDVVFDYLMKPGVASSSNAIRLLRVVGFPTEIIEGAEALVKG